MDCGFRITYGYTESDEISLLLDVNEATFSRKVRKLNSVLAGEASARFSLILGDVGCFDCRLSEEYEKEALNEKTGEAVTAVRRRLKRVYDLPMRNEYSQFVNALLVGAENSRNH